MTAESIIFDMDGTLWDSSQSVADSWNEVISELPDVDITVTRRDIQGIMGLTMDVIADRFFGNTSKKRRMEIMEACGDHENDYLLKHGGILYENAEKTLSALSEKHRLFIVSNCQKGYIEAFLKYYGLEKLFDGHICWGDNNYSKGDNIKYITEKYSIADSVYVGDTQGDCDSAYYAGAKFIHAAYGFGTADRADAVIHRFDELVTILN